MTSAGARLGLGIDHPSPGARQWDVCVCVYLGVCELDVCVRESQMCEECVCVSVSERGWGKR